MPILSLETSTDVCSVALHEGPELLARAEIHEPQAHAARLAPLIDMVMKQAGASTSDLRAVAVTKGPGSYTGLRIGTSTAKGLCYALDIPLISVGTLELLAYQGSSHNPDRALLCPMIDARRMEVYCLTADAELRIVEPVAAKVIDETTFAETLEKQRMLFFGNGSDKCKQVIRHSNAIFLEHIFPSASSLGEIAGRKFNDGLFEDLIRFTPFYLKEFVAKKAGDGKSSV